MPAALPVSVPQFPRSIDFQDAVDGVDRSLETALASAFMVQQFIMGIKAPGATLYLRPTRIPVADRAAYETAIDNAATAMATVFVNLRTIQSLDPVPNPQVG